ncbi:Arylsulfatase A [Singulisphaera sp. GP187]|uniref:sulfatase family protein n=1 Tax=Singulisphaera sp. GP187 TaxID=1882752 RepID=UPI00092BAC94|nr:sulfatase-like hydrolase/transferase [Singulisphaera sp. GP187]SIN72089.1 Arylsulfatase A [Singulisphaera sp. GP187]
MQRFAQVILFAMVVLAGVPEPAEAAADAGRPNVLLILADDLGYGDLSSFGAADLKTPNIDALVAAGVRFDRFYANSPVCSPTRAALLTGRYPDLVGVPGVIRTHPEDSWGALSPQAVLLPQVLKGAGYRTALVGKWHLGLGASSLPNRRGFDRFHGFLGDMMDDYHNHRRHGINYMRQDDREIDPAGHATDLFSQWAIDFLNECKGMDHPFFLELAYNAPHTPVQPPQEWFAKVRQRAPGLDPKRARLVALIEHLDHGIGQVLAALHANGQAERTLILFTSDNGGQLDAGAHCGPFRGGKQDMYEGGIRVPLCAVWPGRIAPGTRSDRVAVTMDLFPTICEAAGARFEHPIDGVSLLSTFLGHKGPGGPPVERDLIFVRREGGMKYHGQDYYAVRRGEWKLVQNSPFEPFQLFHLGQDPREEHDRSAGERAVVLALSDVLRRHVQRAGTVPWQPPERAGADHGLKPAAANHEPAPR